MNDQIAQLKYSAKKSKAEYDTKVRELEHELAREQDLHKAAAASSRHAAEAEQQLMLRVSAMCFILHNLPLYINMQTAWEWTYLPMKRSLGGRFVLSADLTVAEIAVRCV